jgi:quinol monooxygenase YgiN
MKDDMVIFSHFHDEEKSMKNKRITVLALVNVKEGMEETVKQELLSLVKPTRSEPGCINYDVHQAVDDKSQFMFYENWASMEDLKKHSGSPHLKAYRQKVASLLTKPIEVTLFEMISEQ